MVVECYHVVPMETEMIDWPSTKEAVSVRSGVTKTAGDRCHRTEDFELQ